MANEEMRKVGELNFNTNDIIGRGSCNNIVFSGFHKATSRVAIKRIQRKYGKGESAVQIQEVENMKKAKDHPNILRIFHTEMNDDFLFIAMELCKGTLEDYVKGTYKGPRFESEREILFQITQGLAHLHKLKIVHRDMKPTNILIFVPHETGSKPVMKLADFGISKELKVGKKDFTNTSPANPNGTRGFLPNEVYESDRISFEVDVWALGCIFANTLSGGKHPFGDDEVKRDDLIRKGNAMLMNQKDMKFPHKWDPQAFAVIKSMLRKDPSKRPTVEDVLNHPFFIPYKQRRKHFQQLWNSFKDSVTSDQTVQLEELLLGNISITKSKFDFDYTPLHILCRYCKNENLIDWITLLIEKGADVNAEIHNGDTPLHLLCKNYENDNMIALIKLFIDKGADVNTQNEDGSTPLHYLCLNSFESNPSFNRKDVFHQLLIEKGANVNALYQDERTPLHLLFENEKKNNDMVDIVSLMIEKGANVMAKDFDLNTPLHFLCRNKENDNMMALIKLLTRAGADVNAKENFKATPLHFLCSNYQNGDLVEILQFLIKKCDANVNAKTKHESTLLHQLCCYHKKDDLIDIIQVLMDGGAQVNAKDINGATPLHIVCTFYNKDNLKDIVQLFIDKCVEVRTIKDNNGETPLHKLCRFNKNENNLKDILLLFEQEGAVVNAMDCHGNTPLDYLRKFYISKMVFLKKIGEVRCGPNDIIGEGVFGVVHGGFNSQFNELVAVNQIQRTRVEEYDVRKEVELMMKARNHPNMKFVGFEEDTDFHSIIQECRGTLQEYVEGGYNGPQFESEKEILFQLTQGLAYLHRLNFVHQDINPTNILIYVPPSPFDERTNTEYNPLVKLAHFGRSEIIDEDLSTNLIGTKGWMAPEVYLSMRVGPKSDIFTLGLIFGYTLTKGKHPYGDDPDERVYRIKKKEHMKMVRNDLKEPYSSGNDEAFDLIKSMLVMHPDERPTAEHILNSLFFPVNRKKLSETIRSLFKKRILTDDFDLIKLLMNDSIDSKVILESGYTPLHILCYDYKEDNLIDLVRYLIKEGEHVNTIDCHGRTPLHSLCCYYKNDNLINIVQLLIEKGAEVNTKNTDGWTPLHSLCCYYKNENLIDIVQLLVQNGAEVDAKNNDGSTPLHLLCCCNAIKAEDNLKSLVFLFLENGANINEKDNEGKTPNDYLILKKISMFGMEPINLAEPVDVPKDVNLTKDEDATVQSVTTITKTLSKLNEEQIVTQPLNTQHDEPSNSSDDGARNHNSH